MFNFQSLHIGHQHLAVTYAKYLHHMFRSSRSHKEVHVLQKICIFIQISV